MASPSFWWHPPWRYPSEGSDEEMDDDREKQAEEYDEKEKDKPRLSEKQKKTNHVESEQRRRNNIRDGFNRLAELVPGLEGKARSEGLVIHTTLEHIRALLKERRALIEAAEARGVFVEPELKQCFEMLPDGWLDATPDETLRKYEEEMDLSRENSEEPESSEAQQV